MCCVRVALCAWAGSVLWHHYWDRRAAAMERNGRDRVEVGVRPLYRRERAPKQAVRPLYRRKRVIFRSPNKRSDLSTDANVTITLPRLFLNGDCNTPGNQVCQIAHALSKGPPRLVRGQTVVPLWVAQGSNWSDQSVNQGAQCKKCDTGPL